uniref:Uncharacterized protein n=1 Tax=mine drainage metagenome TaxID=410659 RepID=E6PV13_9ZZZZ
MSIKTYLAYTLFTLRRFDDESKRERALSVAGAGRTENGGLLTYRNVRQTSLSAWPAKPSRTRRTYNTCHEIAGRLLEQPVNWKVKA